MAAYDSEEEEEDYAEKIFRLTFRKDGRAQMMPGLVEIRELVDEALIFPEKLESKERVSINPYPGNERRALEQIRKIVLERNLEQDPEFNRILDILAQLDPKDPMVDQIEKATSYLKRVTRQMIKTTDDFLNATVEVRGPDTTIEDDEDAEDAEDEDVDEKAEENEKRTKEYENVLSKIHDILAFPEQKVLVDEETKDDMRREILHSMATGGKYADLLEHHFQTTLSTFLAEKKKQMDLRAAKFKMEQDAASKKLGLGGTKRRKSKTKKTKKTKRTKRPKKTKKTKRRR